MKIPFVSGFALVPLLVAAGLVTAVQAQNPDANDTLPPQNGGIAYTRTGKWSGIYKISDQVAVFVGSRYGFVKGLRVNLDDQDPLHTEALLRGGQIYVPASFAGYLTLGDVTPDAPPPDYLKYRWVYNLPRPPYTPPASVRTLQVNGRTMIDLADVGNALGLHVFQDDTGLLCIGRKPDFDYTTHELNLRDSTITAFDSPEKLADPMMAAKHLFHLPNLIPAPKPPDVPLSSYSLTGFSFHMLGGKVPPPGVYPRLLFSPEDIPLLQERIQQNKIMQMSLAEMDAMFKATWWDPNTSDGKMFAALAKGEPTTYTSEGHGADIYSSNVNYPTNCLTSMALFCLLTGDDAHGQMAANAIYNYYKNVEPRVDELLATSESEFADVPALANFSATNWQGMDDVVAHLDLGLALDFAGHWMTPEQKDLMRRVIVKATYGRRTTAGNGLSHLLALTAIEGLPGFDAEGYAADAELTQSFLDYGFDAKGQLTEMGTKAGDLQFQVLSMIVLARRGDNLWGNPHWRNYLNGALTASIRPKNAAGVDPNDGGPYDSQTIMEYHGFYPDEKSADQILNQRSPNFNLSALDLTLFNQQLANETAAHMHQLKLRLPGPSNPGFAPSILYDIDWKPPTLGE